MARIVCQAAPLVAIRPAATTLLVALGSLTPTWETFGLVAVGVVTTAGMGEWLRRIGGADARPPD